MKMKKAVSALSALTIAVGAFAGMAVTASAADEVEVSFIGTSVSAESFDSYTSTNWTPAMAEIEGNAGFNVVDYGEANKALLVRSGNQENKSVTYELDNAVDNGTIFFTSKLSFASAYAHDGSAIAFQDESGNNVVSINFKAGSSNVYTTVTGSETKNGASNQNFNTRKIDSLTVDVTINFAEGKAEVYYQNSAGAEESLEVNIQGSADVKKLVLTTNNSRNRDSQTSDTYFDDVKFYALTKPNAASELNISYKTDAGSVANTIYDIASQGITIGENASYSIPKYITGTDGNLYKVADETYARTVKTTSETTDVEIPVTLTSESAHTFIDLSGVANNACSNASAQSGIAPNQVPVEFTVAEDGIYKVEGAAYCTSGTSGRYFVLSKSGYNRNGMSGVPQDDIMYQSESFGRNDGVVLRESQDDIELKAGTTYYIMGSSSDVLVDYVLLIKTGDIVEIPEVEDPLATAVVKNNYTTSVEESKDNASLWQLNVKAGTNAIKSVGVEVKIGETTGTTDKTITGDTAVISGGEAVFAIVVNRHADEITEINALLDGTSYSAYTQTVE